MAGPAQSTAGPASFDFEEKRPMADRDEWIAANAAAALLPVLILEVAPDKEPWLFEQFGIGDLVGVEGAGGRTVRLSASSDLVCPTHGRQLKPDACRSCAFLADKAKPSPSRRSTPL